MVYHANGKIAIERKFVPNSDLVLSESFYFPNGQLQMKNTYLNGLLEGEVKIFREDGSLKEIKNFKKDKLDGKREFYDENGELIRVEIYKAGKIEEK